MDSEIEYIIYARKSTDEKSDKQAASIPQQIEACYKYAKLNNLVIKKRSKELPIEDKTIQELKADNTSSSEKLSNLLAFYTEHEIYTERGSAKTPYTRKVWRHVIELIKAEKVSGLLGYSPDRYTRNILEGGELIQLADENLVDLKFANFSFENNAAGHMMLGVWFVFAEHYSKKLREDVLRGSSKKHLEGLAIGTRKYGYQIDDDDRFVPDEFHFPLLQKAFEMKLEGNSDALICKYLNENGWSQKLNSSSQKEQMTVYKISTVGLWADSFYYGVYERVFKSESVKVDLREIDTPGYSFIPAISESNWYLLQEKLAKKNATIRKRLLSQRSKDLLPLKPLPDKFIWYHEAEAHLNFALPNPERFKKKAERQGKHFMDIVEPHQLLFQYTSKKEEIPSLIIKWTELEGKILNILKKFRVSEEDYKAYLYVKTKELEEQGYQHEQGRKQIQILINKYRDEEKKFLSDTRYGQGLTKDLQPKWKLEREKYQKKIKEYENQLKEIDEVQEGDILEFQDFMDTLKNLANTWEKASYVQKCKIVDTLFLNIEINTKKQLKLNLKEEVSDLFVRGGGPGWT